MSLAIFVGQVYPISPFVREQEIWKVQFSYQHKKSQWRKENEDKEEWGGMNKKRQKKKCIKGSICPEKPWLLMAYKLRQRACRQRKHLSSLMPAGRPSMKTQPALPPLRCSLPVAPTVVLYFSQLGTLALHHCRNLMADRTKSWLNNDFAEGSNKDNNSLNVNL